jgi:hypothetical protein
VAKLIAKHYAEIVKNALAIRKAANGLPMPDIKFKGVSHTRWSTQAKLADVLKFLQSV